MILPKQINNFLLFLLRHTNQKLEVAKGFDCRWSALIKATYDNLPHSDMQTFMLKYFIEQLSPDIIMYDLCIERSTLYSWRNSILANLYMRSLDAHVLKMWS